MSSTKIEGVIAAVPTPLLGDGTLDIAAFLGHCRWALANGADGLNVLGTTGEANSQSVGMRKSVMKAAGEALDPGQLMVGTATPDFDTTLELTQYADALGYPVALVLPPYYYKPVPDSALLKWFEALDRALGDAKIEIYLYNFPALTGIPFTLDLIGTLPARVTGIKDSSADLPYCRDIVAQNPDFRVFPSSETCLGTARSDGFAGCISASVNVTAPLAARLWHSEDAGLLQTITNLRTAMASVSLIAAVKYLISRREKDTDWEALHLPLEPLTASQKENLEDAVKVLGY